MYRSVNIHPLSSELVLCVNDSYILHSKPGISYLEILLYYRYGLLKVAV